ncbi:MAG TPA: G1 family glutamic endopeptidase [Aliidongia sp.]|uniref:G1 family glutamic endopeptidase n=1 Tax=Aliidongia sp. TaxID=1914230 RepID=UPI002DDCD147|nr:G1 family glutamic endopeptidase [Aliidongia sp.]HEV2674531.1 G1 family glutamic endopeptidase [Aliidongia sp.]
MMLSIGKDLVKISAGLVILSGCFSSTLAFAAEPATREVPLNLPGARTYVDPPAAFNPLTAPDADLALYGFPPRPDATKSPATFATWQKAMAASQNHVVPALEQTQIMHGPANKSASVKNTSSSYNWSGYVLTNQASSYGSSSYYFLVSDYIVPIAEQAFGTCNNGWDYSSTWAGIDGWSNGDVLQAGTESDAYCYGNSSSKATYYSAWYEWYPYGEVRIGNFPIAPGDDIFVEVWSTSNTAGHAYMVNYTNNTYVNIAFSAPPGTHLVGNSAEWVVERPSVGGRLANLTNYVSDVLWAADAYDFGYRAGSPGAPGASSSIPVQMLDNNGAVISYPTLIGPAAFVANDTGSAR